MYLNNYVQDFIDIANRLSLTDEEKNELYSHIEKIVTSDKWDEMRCYRHHMDSRAMHSLEVCCVSWRRAKKIRKCDAKAVAIGALLHDFFLYDWQNEKVKFDIKRTVYLPKLHGFMHPSVAFENVCEYFPEVVDKKIEDIIVRHMWPLTINPPKCRESWVVCMADKKCSLKVFKFPLELPKYIGIKIFKDKQL